MPWNKEKYRIKITVKFIIIHCRKKKIKIKKIKEHVQKLK